jgi:GTPase SAR1 family protein
MASNFRDKEAFIVVYDMNSMIEVQCLENWFNKILEMSNNSYSIIFALGNSTDVTNDQLD